MDLIDTPKTEFSLDSLQIPEEEKTKFLKTAERDHGLVIICGGTTKLKADVAAAVVARQDPQFKAHTLLNPGPEGNEFLAEGWPSVIRYWDSDYLIVDGITDKQSRENTIRVALTGHLVYAISPEETPEEALLAYATDCEEFLVAESVKAILHLKEENNAVIGSFQGFSSCKEVRAEIARLQGNPTK